MTTVPEAPEGEGPVDGEEERTVGGPPLHRGCRPPQRRPQGIEALAGAGRHRHHLGRLEDAAGDEGGEVGVEEPAPVVAEAGKEVGLGEGDDPRPHAEELADVEVLARLGHDPLVGGDHQDGQVDPSGPAAMAFTKRSWPGTSPTPATVPSGKVRWAKPSSRVMPRRFSSGSRSGSMPVRAFTSEVLPWSTCPAVPMITSWTGRAVAP